MEQALCRFVDRLILARKGATYIEVPARASCTVRTLMVLESTPTAPDRYTLKDISTGKEIGPVSNAVEYSKSRADYTRAVAKFIESLMIPGVMDVNVTDVEQKYEYDNDPSRRGPVIRLAIYGVLNVNVTDLQKVDKPVVVCFPIIRRRKNTRALCSDVSHESRDRARASILFSFFYCVR